jgi:GNAT superfamily N-acetyltransferase
MNAMEAGQRITARVRDAVEADAQALSAFAAALFRETYKPTAAAVDLEAYIARHFRPELQAAEIADSDGRTLIAEINSELVGYAQLQTGPAPACVQGAPGTQQCAIEVRRFYVAPRWHGRGIAQQLMTACLETRQDDLPVWLGVFTHNARAITFYSKCGFRVAGDTTFYMGETPERDHVMVWNSARSGDRDQGSGN